MKIENELLALFCDQKSWIPWFAKPCRKDGRIFATDGCIMFRFNEEYSEKAEAYDKCERRYTEPQAPDCNLRIRALDIKEVLQSLVDNNTLTYGGPVKCKECDGDCFVEWHYEAKDGMGYERLSRCPVCDGRGFVEVKDSIVPIKIDSDGTGKRPSPMFKHFYVQKILKAMDMLGLQEARVVNIGEMKVLRIILDEETGAEILLFPLVCDTNEDVKVIKTEII